MIEIQYLPGENFTINTDLIQQAVSLTLKKLNQLEMDLTIRITGDDEMRRLNQTFRGIDKSTDVLSFNQNYFDPDTHRQYLGDIIISVDQARRQSLSQKHSLDLECAFLAIHGTLHLLGYDHNQPENRKEMWGLQEEIFVDLKKKAAEESK